jgi:hypothetical protein
MANILLVEPDYRSKFPPLGLLRIATYHKERVDSVTFVRGRDDKLRSLKWHRIYVSSLFTYELPRTVKTLRFYCSSVDSKNELIVGGIGATLMPEYVRKHIDCRIILGPLSQTRLLDGERKPLAKYEPDYSIIDNEAWGYTPKDSYFCRVTLGCIRRCKFCAVPKLEPEFSFFQPLTTQIKAVNSSFGIRRHLVLLDNNILACSDIDKVINDIARLGFRSGAMLNGRQRKVDFNQGIDARLINKNISKSLSSICLSPVRLAFDYKGMEVFYVRAIKELANVGFKKFTNYVMYNFNDDPDDFYYRIRLNAELSEQLGIQITGFPMRFRPIYSTKRGYVSENWRWRYLRGIQCVLLATHGLVSPNLNFFNAAFGADLEEFLEILAMPDRYIIFRDKYLNNGVKEWRRSYRHLSKAGKNEFLEALAIINKSRDKLRAISEFKRFTRLFEHYYPGGQSTRCE